MTLYKPKNSPFYSYDFLFRGERKRGSTKLRNKTAARRYEAKLRERCAAQRGGIVDPDPAPLFKDFAIEFLERVAREIGPKTRRGYRTCLGLRVQDGKLKRREDGGGLIGRLGSKRLNEITADDLERWKQERLENRISPSTINGELRCVRRILNFAMKLDLIVVTPFTARKVRFLREKRHERILTYDEERRYLGAATQPLHDVAQLMVEIGLRPGEIFGIRCEDVHLAADPAFVHVQTGKTAAATRDVPITARAREVLKERLAKAREEKGQYLFPLRIDNGHDWDEPMNELQPAHRKAITAAGITPPFRVYDLRHTYGTRAIEGGTDPLTVSRLMGHTDLKTTSRYVHLSQRHLGEAQKKIEQHRALREIAEAEAQKKFTEAVQ